MYMEAFETDEVPNVSSCRSLNLNRILRTEVGADIIASLKKTILYTRDKDTGENFPTIYIYVLRKFLLYYKHWSHRN